MRIWGGGGEGQKGWSNLELSRTYHGKKMLMPPPPLPKKKVDIKDRMFVPVLIE